MVDMSDTKWAGAWLLALTGSLIAEMIITTDYWREVWPVLAAAFGGALGVYLLVSGFATKKNPPETGSRSAPRHPRPPPRPDEPHGSAVPDPRGYPPLLTLTEHAELPEEADNNLGQTRFPR